MMTQKKNSIERRRNHLEKGRHLVYLEMMYELLPYHYQSGLLAFGPSLNIWKKFWMKGVFPHLCYLTYTKSNKYNGERNEKKLERGERVDSLFSFSPHRSSSTRQIHRRISFLWPTEGLYPSVATPLAPESSFIPSLVSVSPYPLCSSSLVFRQFAAGTGEPKRWLSVSSVYLE